MGGKSILRTFALLAALAIIPVTASAAIQAAENGRPPLAGSVGVPVANVPDAVSLADYELVPFDTAADTTPLLNRLVQSGAAIWELPPFVPDPAPLAIFGLGLLAVGFLRLFRQAR